jgi:Major royal jelly protein
MRSERDNSCLKTLFQSMLTWTITASNDFSSFCQFILSSFTDSLDSSRIFVTIPRFSEGIPMTLGYLTQPGMQITPYPDYSWHSSHGANCDRITSVLRVAIDECNQLWVLDTGKIGDIQKCPPQLFVFNLRSNRLVHNYKFPASQYTKDSLFINPVKFNL